MALFVIVSGGLLIIAGAIALLAGFDIVMTERGSAMVSGGVTALSGGVIAVGIGFVILRLSQLLGALESSVEEAPESLERSSDTPSIAQDRPVISVVKADNDDLEPLRESRIGRISDASDKAEKPASIFLETVHSKDETVLVSPLSKSKDAEHKTSARKSLGLGAGLAAAGGLVAAGFGLAKKRPSNQPNNDEPHGIAPENNSAVATEAAIQPTLSHDLLVPSSMESVVAFNSSPFSEGPLAEETASRELTMPDLEAELSRALDETMLPLPANASSEDLPPLDPPSASAFNEGLSRILEKPSRRNRKSSADETDAGHDLQPLNAVLAESDLASNETESFAELDPVEIEERASQGKDHGSDQDSLFADASAVSLEHGEAEPLKDETDQPDPIGSSHDAQAVHDTQAHVSSQAHASSQAHVSSPSSDRVVLGTYSADGGTYTMFANGTVEAVTEAGVRIFGSMEELRLYLART